MKCKSLVGMQHNVLVITMKAYSTGLCNLYVFINSSNAKQIFDIMFIAIFLPSHTSLNKYWSKSLTGILLKKHYMEGEYLVVRVGTLFFSDRTMRGRA